MVGLFDYYNRVARLSPALLALLPLVAFSFLIYPGWARESIAQNVVLLVVLYAVFYLLASTARYRGKRIEPNLISAWGGWPTTILLRHCDATIDPHTKRRYHEELSALTALPMPSPHEEARSPRDSDDRYRSATLRLMEARRDPQYRILHQENASYGFRRNMLGIKFVAIALSIVVALAAFGLWRLPIPEHSVRAQYALLVALLSVAWAILWAFLITRGFVLQAAREYSLALLKTLDA